MYSLHWQDYALLFAIACTALFLLCRLTAPREWRQDRRDARRLRG